MTEKGLRMRDEIIKGALHGTGKKMQFRIGESGVKNLSYLFENPCPISLERGQKLTGYRSL